MVLSAACQSEGSEGRAAADLRAAATRMQDASGYRFEATVAAAGTQVSLTGEFQAPDRVHQIVGVNGKPAVEVVFIGAQVFVRDPATKVWLDQVQSTNASSVDVRRAFTTLAEASAVTRTRDVYQFELTPTATRSLIAGASNKPAHGRARLDNMAISELTYRVRIDGRLVMVTVKYSDIGTSPPVETPPVGL